MTDVLTERGTARDRGTEETFRFDKAALQVVGSPLAGSLISMSTVLQPLVAHTSLIQLSPACSYSPFKITGQLEVGAAAPTARDLAALRPLLVDDRYQGHVDAFGRGNDIVVLGSQQTEPAALLTIIGPHVASAPAHAVGTAHRLWDLMTAHRVAMQADLSPTAVNVSRAVAATRANVIAELSDVHAAALSSILRVLRDRALPPADAVTRATELAVEAVAALRDRAEINDAFSEQRSGDAFERLVSSIRRSLRPGGVRVDVRRPTADDGADRLLAHDVVAATAATVRAIVHTMVDPSVTSSATSTVKRVHLTWVVGDGELRATVRDDGPGLPLRGVSGLRHLEERVASLGGRLLVDAVPDWGTTVTVVAPLAPTSERGGSLSALSDRELDVLARVTAGRRNRQIADDLHISVSTVKFHIANVFGKLGVSSRGEAAAVAHRSGVA